MHNVCGLIEIGEPTFRNLVAKSSTLMIARIDIAIDVRSGSVDKK